MRDLCSAAVVLALGFVTPAVAREHLPALNVDLGQTSVSGISSGGYMAVQFGVAHSEIVAGVGVFAGGPFGCADRGAGEALGTCMKGQPDVARAVAETGRAASTERVAPTSHLARQRVWLFSGYNDGVVRQSVVDSLEAYYRQYLPAHQIYYQDTRAAGHAMITAHYGADCAVTGGEFINDCDYDGAGLLLQHIYGRLRRPPATPPGGRIIEFDQDAFVEGPAGIRGMSDTAFVYVPADCSAGRRCRVHVAFHGCRQFADEIGDAFYRNAGYNTWAEANRIVVLYPQTIATSLGPFNPKGCWDWWGFNGHGFAWRDGPQIAAVRAMLEHLSSGGGEAAPAALPGAPVLSATDASAGSVSLAWTPVQGAVGYHVHRAGSENGPFSRISAKPVAGTSYADHGLESGGTYVYRVSAAGPGGEGPASNTVATRTRGHPPPCDPFFSDNVSHVSAGRASVWFGLVFARGSWDYMGLWNVLTETSLYRDGERYQVGVCP